MAQGLLYKFEEGRAKGWIMILLKGKRHWKHELEWFTIINAGKKSPERTDRLDGRCWAFSIIRNTLLERF